MRRKEGVDFRLADRRRAIERRIELAGLPQGQPMRWRSDLARDLDVVGRIGEPRRELRVGRAGAIFLSEPVERHRELQQAVGRARVAGIVLIALEEGAGRRLVLAAHEVRLAQPVLRVARKRILGVAIKEVLERRLRRPVVALHEVAVGRLIELLGVARGCARRSDSRNVSCVAPGGGSLPGGTCGPGGCQPGACSPGDCWASGGCCAGGAAGCSLSETSATASPVPRRDRRRPEACCIGRPGLCKRRIRRQRVGARLGPLRLAAERAHLLRTAARSARPWRAPASRAHRPRMLSAPSRDAVAALCRRPKRRRRGQATRACRPRPACRRAAPRAARRAVSAPRRRPDGGVAAAASFGWARA